jgi:hypothetical protein
MKQMAGGSYQCTMRTEDERLLVHKQSGRWMLASVEAKPQSNQAGQLDCSHPTRA